VGFLVRKSRINFITAFNFQKLYFYLYLNKIILRKIGKKKGGRRMKIYQKEREIIIRRKVNSWNERDKGGWKKKRQNRMIKKAAGS